MPRREAACICVLTATVLCGIAQEAPAASRVLEKPECPSAGARAVSFADAVDGVSFRTTEGSEVRLAGVIAPGGGGETRANATAARDALVAILKSGPLTMATDQRPDRYGRILAQVFADGTWVQGQLLRLGFARALPELGGSGCAKALLAAEGEGRQAEAGHWANGGFAMLSPENLKGRIGTFQIVEGKVVSASLNIGRAYINFGPDYRTDFTVTVTPKDMRAFRAAKFDVKNLAGKRVRVRGWIESYNGPEMEVATPAAIEVLE